MRIATLIATLASAGCTSGNNGRDTPKDTDTPTPTQSTPEDTGFSDVDEGSVMLVRRQTSGDVKVELYGLFVDEHPGFHNLARCAVAGGICLDYLPEEDDYVDLDPDRVFDPQFSEYRYVGLEIGLGDWTAPYYNDEVSYYYEDLTEEIAGEEIRGEFGVHFGVQWGDYSGNRDIRVSNDFDLTSPQRGQVISMHDGTDLVLEWVPNGEGEVLLTLRSGALYNRLYLLRDDGYFSLPISSLGLGTEPMKLIFTLERWNRGLVRSQGNELEIIATSEVSFLGDYFYTGGRDPIEMADTCMTAHVLPPLQSGSYFGKLLDDGYTNTTDINQFGNSCTGKSSYGEDSVVRVVLEPKGYLAANYVLLSSDASIYLLEDCGDVTSCVAGADEGADAEPESLSYFNDSDDEAELFLGLDGAWTSPGQFELDVQIATLVEPEIYDTCPEAMAQVTPLSTGMYYTDYLPFSNELDPGTGGCTGSTLTGPEAMTKVVLLANQAISVNVEMPGGNPAVYLLYNCSSPFSCAVGADQSIGPTEALTYTNTSGASENLYLVIDSRSSLRPFFMSVTIQ